MLRSKATIFVTGGAGFIGSAVIRRLLDCTDASIVNIDKMTYASSPDSIPAAAGSDRYVLSRTDVCDSTGLRSLFDQYRPQAVMHLAAESHGWHLRRGGDLFVLSGQESWRDGRRGGRRHQ